MSAYNEFNPPIREPLLIVISGPSGVGKDSVVDQLCAMTEHFHFVVTATTRAPRHYEVNGKDYIFLSKDQFAEMIEKNEFLEYAVVYNDFKGIPKQQVRDALATGKDVILRLDVQGTETVRELCQDALLIFLTVESEQELERRLTARKTEQTDDLKLRIATARKELQRMNSFDYLVVNPEGKLARTVSIILAIIEAEHHRLRHRKINLD